MKDNLEKINQETVKLQYVLDAMRHTDISETYLKVIPGSISEYKFMTIFKSVDGSSIEKFGLVDFIESDPNFIHLLKDAVQKYNRNRSKFIPEELFSVESDLSGIYKKHKDDNSYFYLEIELVDYLYDLIFLNEYKFGKLNKKNEKNK
jgi:hypothetical protein